MAAKFKPFTITITYSGKKTIDEISKAYHDFYFKNIEQRLIDSNLSDLEKKAAIDRLICYHSQSNLETKH